MRLHLFLLGGRKSTAVYRPINNASISDDEFSLSDDEKTLFKRPAEIELNLYPETKISRSKNQGDFCKYFSIFCTVVVLSVVILTVSVLYAKNHGPQTGLSTNTTLPVKLRKNSTEWELKIPNRSKSGFFYFKVSWIRY